MTGVLLTGGGGFVGRHTCRALLEQGVDVHVAQRDDPQIPGARFHPCDLTSEPGAGDLIRQLRPDGLIHLAWTTEHGRFWNDEANSDWLAAGKALIDRFLDCGGSRAVFAGSCAEYDWRQTGSERLSENARLAPATVYGQAKRDLWLHIEDCIGQGASLCWGRLFFLYGPGENPARFVPSVITALLQDKVARMSPGSQIRDFMHSADAGSAFASLHAANGVTGAVNIASGEDTSLLHLAETLLAMIGRGSIDNEAYPLRPDDPPFLVADTSRLTSEVGFRPQYDLRTGLENCVTWWRENIAEGDTGPSCRS